MDQESAINVYTYINNCYVCHILKPNLLIYVMISVTGYLG